MCLNSSRTIPGWRSVLNNSKASTLLHSTRISYKAAITSSLMYRDEKQKSLNVSVKSLGSSQ